MDKNERIKVLVEELNDLARHIEWYQCGGCARLILGSGTDLEISKWGQQEEFCEQCIQHCDECDTDYADSMAYRHADCKQADDESDLSSSEESDKSGEPMAKRQRKE